MSLNLDVYVIGALLNTGIMVAHVLVALLVVPLLSWRRDETVFAQAILLGDGARALVGAVVAAGAYLIVGDAEGSSAAAWTLLAVTFSQGLVVWGLLFYAVFRWRPRFWRAR